MISRIFFGWKYLFVLPHLLCCLFSNEMAKQQIKEDVEEMNRRCNKHENLAFYLVFRKPYRNLFYYRIGKYPGYILGCILPPYENFTISCKHIGGAAFVLNHPYSTIINAKSIGSNFTICHLTTIGNKMHGRNDLVPQSKIFNICNIYIFIWILYMFHWQNLGSLFPALDSISNLLLAINLAISIYYSFVFWNKYKQVPIFISINILLISMIIYGILSLIGFNLIDTFMHKEADINSGTYLISALRTFLPIYTFYIFTKKGYITEKYISNLVWIFLPLCIFIFLPTNLC